MSVTAVPRDLYHFGSPYEFYAPVAKAHPHHHTKGCQFVSPRLMEGIAAHYDYKQKPEKAHTWRQFANDHRQVLQGRIQHLTQFRDRVANLTDDLKAAFLQPSAVAKKAKIKIGDNRHSTVTGGPGNLIVNTDSVNLPGFSEGDRVYSAFKNARSFHTTVMSLYGLNGKGAEYDASVDYGNNYPNCFWDPESSCMYFGNGDGKFLGRFTEFPEVGFHELTHGHIQYEAGKKLNGGIPTGLNYGEDKASEQAGMLNEDFADLIGMQMLHYSTKQDAATASWKMGWNDNEDKGLLIIDAKKNITAPLRNAINPGTAYNDPRVGKDPQVSDYNELVARSQQAHNTPLDPHEGGLAVAAFARASKKYAEQYPVGSQERQSWGDVGGVFRDSLKYFRPQALYEDAATVTTLLAKARFGEEHKAYTSIADAWEGLKVPYNNSYLIPVVA